MTTVLLPHVPRARFARKSGLIECLAGDHRGASSPSTRRLDFFAGWTGQLSLINILRQGACALGLNVTRHVDTPQVLDLLKRLRPQDCGIELIRVGGNGDGGYLIPDDLEGIEYCFSPGVGPVVDFENQLADLNIKSFLADYSVDSPPVMRKEFTFDKTYLGLTDRGPYMTLSSWKDKYLKDYSSDLILQMDVDGLEWELILNTPDHLLKQFRIVVIEFHRFQKVFDPFGFTLLSSCFDKLLEFFHIVHIHPNNAHRVVRKGEIEIPVTLEFTFLNKKRVTHSTPQKSFPHRLDRDNWPGKKSVVLPRCWFEDPRDPAQLFPGANGLRRNVTT